jgi:hypothetical protein
MKKIIVTALVLAAISTSATAANPWIKIGTTPFGFDVYYNTQTISTVNGSVSVLTSGLYGGTHTTTEFINCSNWTHKVIRTTGKASPDHHIVPNTPINTLAEIVCKTA